MREAIERVHQCGVRTRNRSALRHTGLGLEREGDGVRRGAANRNQTQCNTEQAPDER